MPLKGGLMSNLTLPWETFKTLKIANSAVNKRLLGINKVDYTSFVHDFFSFMRS